MELIDRVVAVTGAAQGIGRAIAEYVARAGARVGAIDLAGTALDRAKTEWATQDLPIHGVAADVVSERELAAGVAQLRTVFGEDVDSLVINAGVSERRSLAHLTSEQWQRVISINLTGSFLSYKAFEESMLTSDSPRKSIVLVGSASAFTGSGGGAHYAASKAGQLGMMRALARELGAHGITVNAVAPRTIDTGILDTLYPNAEDFQALKDSIPMGRVGTTEDVAALVEFLLCDRSSFLHGQTIILDGGRSLG